jgi:hypothetical protein
MTWGEFKRQVEMENVKDDDALDWIDVGRFSRYEDADDDPDADEEPSSPIKVRKDENGLKISNP